MIPKVRGSGSYIVSVRIAKISMVVGINNAIMFGRTRLMRVGAGFR